MSEVNRYSTPGSFTNPARWLSASPNEVRLLTPHVPYGKPPRFDRFRPASQNTGIRTRGRFSCVSATPHI